MNKLLKKERIEKEKQYLKKLLSTTILQIKRELPTEGEFREILSRKLEFVSAYPESYEKIDSVDYGKFELRFIKGDMHTLYVCYCPLEFIFLFKADFTYIVHKKTQKVALVDISNMKLKLDLVRTF
jgi:hypothetical protein